MGQTTILNNVTFSQPPVLSLGQSIDETLPITGIAYPDANITYTGTLSSPLLGTLTYIYPAIPTVSINGPLLAYKNYANYEPLLQTFNFGNCQMVESFNPGRLDTLLTSISAPNALLFDISLNTCDYLTTISAPNAIVVALNGTFNVLTTLSFPSATQLRGLFACTMPLLTTLDFPVLQSCVSQFAPVCAILTTLSLPSLEYALNINLITLPLLTSLSMPVFKKALDNGASALACTLPSLTTFSLPQFISSAGAMSLTLAACTSFSMPAFVSAPACVLSMSSLVSFSLPSLTTTAAMTLTLPLATTVSLPVLATVSGALAFTLATVTTMSLPQLVTVLSTFTITAANLVTFSIGSTLKSIGGNFTMTGMKLNQASVDSILVSLAALDGTNGTTAYSSKTVNLSGGTSSTPSAPGLAAKTTLQARGCTVTTN